MGTVDHDADEQVGGQGHVEEVLPAGVSTYPRSRFNPIPRCGTAASADVDLYNVRSGAAPAQAPPIALWAICGRRRDASGNCAGGADGPRAEAQWERPRRAVKFDAY